MVGTWLADAVREYGIFVNQTQPCRVLCRPARAMPSIYRAASLRLPESPSRDNAAETWTRSVMVRTVRQAYRPSQVHRETASPGTATGQRRVPPGSLVVPLPSARRLVFYLLGPESAMS